MIRKFFCNDTGNYSDLTIGKIYEGDTYGDILNIKNDVGYGIKIFVSRFTEVTDDKDLLKTLEAELKVMQAANFKKAQEIETLREKIRLAERPVVGSFWQIVGETHTTYIVAECAFKCYQLISLTSGKRWTDPTDDITKIFGTCYTFKQVLRP